MIDLIVIIIGCCCVYGSIFVLITIKPHQQTWGRLLLRLSIWGILLLSGATLIPIGLFMGDILK